MPSGVVEGSGVQDFKATGRGHGCRDRAGIGSSNQPGVGVEQAELDKVRHADLLKHDEVLRVRRETEAADRVGVGRILTAVGHS